MVAHIIRTTVHIVYCADVDVVPSVVLVLLIMKYIHDLGTICIYVNKGTMYLSNSSQLIKVHIHAYT